MGRIALRLVWSATLVTLLAASCVFQLFFRAPVEAAPEGYLIIFSAVVGGVLWLAGLAFAIIGVSDPLDHKAANRALLIIGVEFFAALSGWLIWASSGYW